MKYEDILDTGRELYVYTLGTCVRKSFIELKKI